MDADGSHRGPDERRRRPSSPSYLARHQSQLFGYIYSLVRDLDDADDLFQQTSLVLWDKFDQFDRIAELRGLGLRRGPVRGPEFPAGPQSGTGSISATSSAWPSSRPRRAMEEERLEERRERWRAA